MPLSLLTTCTTSTTTDYLYYEYDDKGSDTGILCAFVLC